MQHTENFQLGLWEPGDQVLHQSFNENTEKIEAALSQLSLDRARFAAGTYSGNHQCGINNPTVLTVPFKPKVILIWGKNYPYKVHGIAGQSAVCYYKDTISSMDAIWSENSVTFYHSSSPSHQMNRNDDTYGYLVLG